jgi:hypothetical protein
MEHGHTELGSISWVVGWAIADSITCWTIYR